VPKLEIVGFDGIIPRTSPTLLRDNQAQEALNVKLYSRELRYWNGPVQQTATLVSNAQSIYKYYASASNPYWLSWTNAGVDVAISPQADTSDYRLYYTGDGVPKKTNESLVSTGSGAYPRGWLNLGVPAPTGAPTVTPTGGTGSNDTRAYIYTYLSTFGSITEESAPSPATIATGHIDGTFTVSGFSTAPSTNYNITGIRIYRGVSGATYDTYAFVAQITIATSSYADTLTAAQLGAALTTLGWTPPPSNLAGLVALPGGSLAGFSGNTVYFSEPYYPHAWPTKYALNVSAPIVGLGVFGTSVVVMTTRFPYVIDGGVPGAMSVSRIAALEPCLTKLSIVSSVAGVTYASPNGLMQIGPSGYGLQTNQLFRRTEWQAVSPASLIAAWYDNKYVAMFPNISTYSSFIVCWDDIPALSTLGFAASAAHVDSQNGNLYYLDPATNNIFQFDSDANNPMSYEWKSKRFMLPQATTYSAIRVDGDYGQATLSAAYNSQVAAIQASNATIFAGGVLNSTLNASAVDTRSVDGSTMANIPPPAIARSVQVNFIADGTLVVTMNFPSLDIQRIPPFKCRALEILIRGNLSVRSVAMATTVEELLTA
jgi:hypothetical protein